MNAFGLYAQIIGVYDSGLIAPAVVQGKQVNALASYGEEANFGANAAHRWRRGKLSVEYRGSYRQYTNAPAFDGLDQFLQVNYSEALSRHLILDIKSTLGSTTLANGAFAYFSLASLDRIGLPTDELFDNRTNYMQSRVDLTWRLYAALVVRFRRRWIRGSKGVPLARWVERLQCASERGLPADAPANDFGQSTTTRTSISSARSAIHAWKPLRSVIRSR